jgi:type II secretion system protein C
MNRYQREVAEMDSHRKMRTRVLSVVGAAIVAILALWSAGLPPSAWFVALDRWWSSREASPAEVPPSVANLPTTGNDTVTVAPKNSDTASQGTDSSLSPTPLPLYLVATTLGRNKNEGSALIGTSVENPQTYGGGAVLANGTRLAEIYKDHVVLTRGGKSAELYLYQRDPRADQGRSSNDLLTVSAAPLVPVATKKVNEGLTDYVRPSPVYDGEVLRGYQVYPGVRTGVFAQLGLQSGDIVTSINDAPLNEPSQSIELFMQLMRGVAVVATVERKNVSRQITLDGALISADQESIKEASVTNAPALPGS